MRLIKSSAFGQWPDGTECLRPWEQFEVIVNERMHARTQLLHLLIDIGRMTGPSLLAWCPRGRLIASPTSTKISVSCYFKSGAWAEQFAVSGVVFESFTLQPTCSALTLTPLHHVPNSLLPRL